MKRGLPVFINEKTLIGVCSQVIIIVAEGFCGRTGPVVVAIRMRHVTPIPFKPSRAELHQGAKFDTPFVTEPTSDLHQYRSLMTIKADPVSVSLIQSSSSLPSRHHASALLPYAHRPHHHFVPCTMCSRDPNHAPDRVRIPRDARHLERSLQTQRPTWQILATFARQGLRQLVGLPRQTWQRESE